MIETWKTANLRARMRAIRRCAVLAVLSAVLVTWAAPAAPLTATQESGPATVTLRMIVVPSADAAERILARVRAGDNFVTLAAAESTAPSAADGGWLGRTTLGELRPEVRQALDGLRPGQLTRVIRIPTGFAIFKVEADEPAAPIEPVGAALASTGAVKYVYDLGGFSDVRTSLEVLEKAPGWNLDPQRTCDASGAAIAATRGSIEAYLSPANRSALAARDPLDVMQLYVELAQLDAFEGRMDGTIARLDEAYQLAGSSVPAARLQVEEALGLAHLHKAALDNGLFEAPGEFCLLRLTPPAPPYPKPADAQKAIAFFDRYLARKPDELEVRWFLNLAHMAAGGYPSQVPAQFLISAPAFATAGGVGRFRDVAREAGVVNVEVAGGLMVDDFRNTGEFDIVTSTADKCRPARFHAATGTGTFVDRTREAGLSAQLGGLNAVHGDFNNDGCSDVLLLRGGWEQLPQRRSLLKNNCDGTFTDVTAASGLDAPTAAQTAVWTDIDNDGWLDVFIGNENMRAQLFRNRGNGTFEDIAARAGVDRIAFTKGVAAADYDNDRYPDLYVSNYGGANFLYRNNRNGTFSEASAAARVPGTPQGFATWFFDYDNDGWQDLFVTSYVASIDEMVRDYLGRPHNGTTLRLYRNQGDGTFRDVTATAGLSRVLMPMGANFGDIDNDGFLDMYLGTGNPSYGAPQGAVLLRNVDGKTFVDVTATAGVGELHRGHGIAFADLDHDGDQDIVFQVGGMTVGDRHALRLFENPGNARDWISLKLAGVKSAKSAVGARIVVAVEDADGRRRTIARTVTTGGSFGGNPLEQHIGLGLSARRVDVEVWWPATDTRQQFPNVQKNGRYRVEEFAERIAPLEQKPVRLGGGERPR